jgi:hypothetical protein
MRDVANRLEEKVGVNPSEQWLAACQSFLQETNQEATSDAVLHQILHCDLRDVVRPVSTQGGTTTEAHFDASKRLKAAIEASQPNNNNNTSTMPAKQVLDKSFRLLVQVEELLDISMNAESRLAVGPASSNAPTPVGNQQKRCLKLCISDGYEYLPTTTPIIAMEVTPIPNMSVQTKAGVKVVLQGPLEIRWGILMWHPGNATVLGGSVQELVEIQQRALEQAKQVAGVGVDPTIRALIGNTPQPLEDEEGNDEGEEASRDVVVQAPAPRIPVPIVTQQPPPPSQHQTPLMPPPPARHVVPTMGNSSNSNNNSNDRSSTDRINPYASSSQRSTTSSLGNNPYASSTPLINSIPPSSTPTASTTQPRATNPYSSQSSTTTTTATTSSNPYQSSASRTTTTTASSSTNPYAATSGAATSATPANPYQRQSSATSSSSHQQQPTSSSNNPHASSNRDLLTPPSTAAIPMDTSNNDDSMDMTPPVTTTSATTPTTTCTSSSATSAASSTNTSTTGTTTPSTLPQIMTYVNLHKLLSQLLANPEMYRTFQDVTFEVALQHKGGDLHFNIVKKNKSKRKKKRKDSKSDKNDKVRLKRIGCNKKV